MWNWFFQIINVLFIYGGENSIHICCKEKDWAFDVDGKRDDQMDLEISSYLFCWFNSSLIKVAIKFTAEKSTNKHICGFFLYSFLDLKGYDHFLKCEHHFYYPSKLLFENEIQTKEEMSIKNFNWKRQSSILNTDKNKRILQELSIRKAAIFYVK